MLVTQIEGSKIYKQTSTTVFVKPLIPKVLKAFKEGGRFFLSQSPLPLCYIDALKNWWSEMFIIFANPLTPQVSRLSRQEGISMTYDFIRHIHIQMTWVKYCASLDNGERKTAISEVRDALGRKFLQCV